MDSESQTEHLKQILENLRTPEGLDYHPWTVSLFVNAHLSRNSDSDNKSLGYDLAVAVSSLFMEMMPAAAPKRGKRLDTRWGEFGLLAAQYFVPFLFGLPYPGSLRDAWGKIDRAILLCRFGDKPDAFSELEIARYRLVANEPDVAPLSTISDWHVKGVEKLACLIQDREQHLSLLLSHSMIPEGVDPQPIAEESTLPDLKPVDNKKSNFRRLRRWTTWVLITAFLVTLIFAAGKTWSIYQLAKVAQSDAEKLQGFASSPLSLDKVMKAGPLLSQFRQDVDRLGVEAGPVLEFAGPWMVNIPVYGTDLAAAADLLEFAGQTAAALETSYQAALPLLDSFQTDSASLNPQQLARLLVQTKPQLLEARQEIDQVLVLRAGLTGREFSPRIQALLDRLDPMLALLDDGLALGVVLPEILGAGSSGPKTYMLLVQNEDELRPTGGFITSVGTFVVKNGNMFGMQFEEAGDLEDWTLPYPDAPWQLLQYMNSQVLVLRDANWFPNYPTTVEWVEYLYAYKHKHSVDGVIAINQQMLVSVLKVIGPLYLEGISAPVTYENVIQFMRNSKVRPPNAPADWYRKAFISQIADAVVGKLLANDAIDWKSMAQMMLLNLDERNIILQFDDAQVTSLLAKWDLDGAIRTGKGDFLMVVDTNVGFNKTNAVVSRKLSYDVDLTNLEKPTSSLVIFHTNSAENEASCIQWGDERVEGSYPIHYCYWNYLRVLVPEGTGLESAKAHAVPADWMLLGKGVPARVDLLSEDIPGARSFGTLMVVPGGQTLDTSFNFSLSAQVVNIDPATNAKVYTLKIKKQPGTLGVPVAIRIHLPPSAQVLQVPTGAVLDGQNILIETALTTDVSIKVMFTVP